jgi:hypothetical protein
MEENLDMLFEIKVRAKMGTRHGKTDLTGIPGMAKRCQARKNGMPQGHTGAQSSGAQIKGGFSELKNGPSGGISLS